MIVSLIMLESHLVLAVGQKGISKPKPGAQSLDEVLKQLNTGAPAAPAPAAPPAKPQAAKPPSAKPRPRAVDKKGKAVEWDGKAWVSAR